MIKKHPLKFSAIFFFIIFCALSSFVYLTLGTGSISSLIEQMLHREQIITRSGAKAIASFIDLSSKSLLTLADQEFVTDTELKQFISNFSNTPIVSVVKTNSRGDIISAFGNRDTLSPGNNISDRDYFIKAKSFKETKVAIGLPLVSRVPGASQKYKIPMAVPIIKNHQFQGILAIGIEASSLTDDYLTPLKISDQSDILLLNTDGVFLSSLHPEVIGQSIFEYIAQHPFLGDKIVMPVLREKIKVATEQKLDLAIPNLFDHNKITRTLIATSPLEIQNNHWVLVITTPASDALIFISPFILQNLLGIIITFFVSIALTLFFFNHYLKN